MQISAYSAYGLIMFQIRMICICGFIPISICIFKICILYSEQYAGLLNAYMRMCASVNIRINCICVLSRWFHADKRLSMCIDNNA